MDKIYRGIWWITYFFVFRFIPNPFHKIRIFLLRLFGASIAWNCAVYPSVSIWSPRNLTMQSGSALGPRVICYNPGNISIGKNTTVSQGCHLCSGTHDVERASIRTNPFMKLVTKPIIIKDYCWITADVYIGPGVTVNDGVVVGARSVVVKSLSSWSVYAGNPVKLRKTLIKR
ncbi:transferase hexapeptide repeat protein [SAR86 cluster bacterium SAR86E]|uniref:Transferase hexapeptide repeat protein n=1 Tax=SAR86 cluster bacterium SAR86E TaxID=1208365 RepID=K6GGM9_9GAMM|nr:transferase hexapeptide repeat protein [SAR86 cluster bacterium SAR86E]